MAQYSKITKISDVIDRFFGQNKIGDPQIDSISDVLSDVLDKNIMCHIIHINIKDDMLVITVNDQSMRQLLQLQSNSIIQSLLSHNQHSIITKVKILFDTQ